MCIYLQNSTRPTAHDYSVTEKCPLLASPLRRTRGANHSLSHTSYTPHNLSVSPPPQRTPRRLVLNMAPTLIILT